MGLSCGGFALDVIAHEALSTVDIVGIRRLLDAEYLSDFGPWDPELPYGYAPHDVHVVARADGRIVGHVGWARRLIGVGDAQITIAGTGGVLVSDDLRGQRLGAALMKRAGDSAADAGGVDFAYLGCRNEVVPFYASCGWHRIRVGERSLGRDGIPVENEAGQPIMILPIDSTLAAWPEGTVELRGRAW